MRCCTHCCIQLFPTDLHGQCFGCRGPSPQHRKCPGCRPENQLLLHVDGKPTNLLAVLDVRPEAGEGWDGSLRARRGKRCSIILGLVIMTLVMASYILPGAQHALLLLPSPFQSGAFTNDPSLMGGGNLSDGRDQSQLSGTNSSHATVSPSIRLILSTIASKVEFKARQLPDPGDLEKQETHMFSVIPRKFLPNSKNPCWYDEYRGRNASDPYTKNSYALYSKRFRSTFDSLRKDFWAHLYHHQEKHYRLRCLPSFYIIGQPKCGTTDLYDRLKLHPDVKFSAIKEPHWWTRKRFGIVRLRDGLRDRYPVEDYLDLFDFATHQIQHGLEGDSTKGHGKMNRIVIGEASASTMWDNNAWNFFYDNGSAGEPPFLVQDFIHAFQPDAKLIVMLRDPVERLYSDYLYFASSNKSAEDFHEKVAESLQLFGNCLLEYALRACVYNNTLNNAMPVRLQVGLYAVYLLDWLAIYEKEQILVLRLEDHAANVRQTMHKVFQFLNLGPLDQKQEALVTRSPASNTRRPEDRSLGPMWPVTREILLAFYQPFNAKLAQVLGSAAFLWKMSP
ncbi:carbohydrate sulfotransferase 15 [Ornithorhynchus anatinus]|uniref:Sulfotransferase n=1 Tax=Ornithorhynchus anatinus TaxID=9258 RepID=K7ECK4_ORNAN|nr:carbohydrate sulfotransferase 15 [Ornithorhynchus anatinus]